MTLPRPDPRRQRRRLVAAVLAVVVLLLAGGTLGAVVVRQAAQAIHRTVGPVLPDPERDCPRACGAPRP